MWIWAVCWRCLAATGGFTHSSHQHIGVTTTQTPGARLAATSHRQLNCTQANIPPHLLVIRLKLVGEAGLWVNVAALVAAPLLLGLLMPEVLAAHSTQHLLRLEAPATAAGNQQGSRQGSGCKPLLLLYASTLMLLPAAASAATAPVGPSHKAALCCSPCTKGVLISVAPAALAAQPLVILHALEGLGTSGVLEASRRHSTAQVSAGTHKSCHAPSRTTQAQHSLAYRARHPARSVHAI